MLRKCWHGFREVVLSPLGRCGSHRLTTQSSPHLVDEDWVDQVCVDPTWTGQSVGSRLLVVVRPRRPAHVTVWTFQAVAGVRRFYERNGFVAEETTQGDNEEGAPDVRYELPGHAAEPSAYRRPLHEPSTASKRRLAGRSTGGGQRRSTPYRSRRMTTLRWGSRPCSASASRTA
jgi:hypothetical protein